MSTGANSGRGEDLVCGLPLPLAQLARRADHAKNALERHQAAYYLWEAAVQVLAATVCLEREARGRGALDLPERLGDSGGRRWASGGSSRRGSSCPRRCRRLGGALPSRGELLLGGSREDFPRASALDSILREVLDEKRGTEGPIRLAELFDRMVRYRNQELGHGAAGQREASFYERTGNAILEGVGEVLGRVDVLLGGRLVQVGDVRRQASGRWLVERQALLGTMARREESLELSDADRALPHPEHLYLEVPSAGGPGGPPVLRSMHPLAFYASDTGEFFFLSGLRGTRRGRYLSYTSGRTVYRDVLRGDPHGLVSSVLGLPVDVETGGGATPDEDGDDASEGSAEGRRGRGGSASSSS